MGDYEGTSWIEKALAKRKIHKALPIKKDFGYNPIGSFTTGNAYDIAFCYPHPLYERSFILKGGHQVIRKYLKEMNTPMIVHHTLYQKGIHRIFYEFYGIENRVAIHKEYAFNKNMKKYRIADRYNLVKYSFGETDRYGAPIREKKILATFKRVPRRWIRELNLYIAIERRSFHDGSTSSS